MEQLTAALRAAASGSAEAHVRVHVGLNVVAAVLHLLVGGFSYAVMIGAVGGGRPRPPPIASPAHSGGFLVAGAVLVLYMLVVLAWLAFGVVWAPANAIGLWRRRPWARASTLVYAAFCVLSCVGLPYGLYALWSLRRSDVRELFNASRGS